jgi:NO-binding membrane sensor protein with MHYT domain
MLTVYECLTVEHDLRLVALAGLLCMFASFSALHLLARAREDVAWRRLLWILGAGSVAGCGIWATHFIAMLAYRPDYPVSYHTGITVLSFVVAVIFSTAGFAVAVRFRAAALGGAIVGLAIGAMHYIGMSAISVHGFILWDRGLVAGSIITGTLFAAVALEAAFRLRKRVGIHAGWMLLTLAICSLHFTGMAAINMSTGPDLALSGQRISSFTLALAVAAVTFLLAVVSYVGLAVERYLAHRAVQEAKRLRTYVTELEQTKKKLEDTSAELLVALNTASAADKAKSQFLATMSHLQP